MIKVEFALYMANKYSINFSYILTYRFIMRLVHLKPSALVYVAKPDDRCKIPRSASNHPRSLNILKKIESAIHGKELNLEMPLHSYFIFECVCLRACSCFNGILLLKKEEEKKAVEEKRPCPL